MKQLFCVLFAALLLAGCAQAPAETADLVSQRSQAFEESRAQSGSASKAAVSEVETEAVSAASEDTAGAGEDTPQESGADLSPEDESAEAQPEDSYKIVEFFDFLFVYNTDYTLTRMDDATAAVYFETPDCFAVVQYMGAAAEESLTRSGAEEILATIRRSLDAVNEQTEYTELVAMTVAGRSAYRVSARLVETAGGEAQIQCQTFFVLNGSFYNIGYAAPEEKYARYYGAYSDIISSAISIEELEAMGQDAAGASGAAAQ